MPTPHLSPWHLSRWRWAVTDARFPERYLVDRRVTNLSPRDFRSFVMATAWSVSNRTDGVVLQSDLVLIPLFAVESVEVLVGCGLFAVEGDGWLLTDFAGTQTSRHDLEVLDNARRADREKKRRQRLKEPSFASSPGDSLGGRPPGRVPGTGQDRTGQARYNETDGENQNSVWSDREPWPVTVPGTVCMVPGCGNKLISPEAQSQGVCRRGDEAHQMARAA